MNSTTIDLNEIIEDLPNPQLEENWKNLIGDEFHLDYMKELKLFLQKQIKTGKEIFPKGKKIFEALNSTPFDSIKVVIVGQDPYHGPGQAHGLSFSVNKGIPLPPSLQNIYKELNTDLGFEIPKSGYLMPWAKQGVLLLNSVLTVENGNANAHQGKGWERFTDRIISEVNSRKKNVVFLLWGSYAQKKAAQVDPTRHFIIKSPHPSPLSAYRGFFGSKPFSKINAYLRSTHQAEIDWRLDPN